MPSGHLHVLRRQSLHLVPPHSAHKSIHMLLHVHALPLHSVGSWSPVVGGSGDGEDGGDGGASGGGGGCDGGVGDVGAAASLRRLLN